MFSDQLWTRCHGVMIVQGVASSHPRLLLFIVTRVSCWRHQNRCRDGGTVLEIRQAFASWKAWYGALIGDMPLHISQWSVGPCKR